MLMRKRCGLRNFAAVAVILAVAISILLFSGALIGRDAQPALIAATTTPTPTPAPTPPPIPTPTPIDISGSISGNGTAEQDIVYSVLGGQAVLNISQGTTALTAASGPLQSLAIEEDCFNIPAAPVGAYIIGCAYDYQPNGATFNPAATMTLKYDPGLLPDGVDASKLVIAYYDAGTSRWIVVPSVVDTVNHAVAAQIGHFSLFTIYSTTATPVTG